MDTTATGGIVVAIDESSAGRAALDWAADHARHVHARLRAVHVMRYDFGAPPSWAPGLLTAPHTVPTSVVELAKTSIRELFESISPEPSWTLDFLDGPAAERIVDFADGAELLVVGSRELRGVERVWAGSVSHYCLTHTSCPIVVVPAVGASTATRPWTRGAATPSHVALA